MPEEIISNINKAESASAKKAAFGEDLDLSAYGVPARQNNGQIDPASISGPAREKMSETGMFLEDSGQRSGTFIQMDNSPMHASVVQDGIEVMSTSEALAKYDWVKEYLWNAVSVDADKYTAHVELNHADGYFVRALPGVKSEFPVQACLYMNRGKNIQDVHNIIIAEENSELHIITGCSTAGHEPGVHLGVSEFYIKKNAKITFTMIHSWTSETDVRPRTGVIIEDDGLFLSNYIIMRPVKSVQAYPFVKCNGINATARFNSVVVATPGSHIDLGSKAFLNAANSKTEMVARTITTGGDIISRGYIEGNCAGAKGHLECRGLIIGEKGYIHAIPELKGSVAGVDLSHEAAVGKIAEEEVEYLMARGLTRDEATAAIIRGFLKVDIDGLPDLLNVEIQRAIKSCEQELF